MSFIRFSLTHYLIRNANLKITVKYSCYCEEESPRINFQTPTPAMDTDGHSRGEGLLFNPDGHSRGEGLLFNPNGHSREEGLLFNLDGHSLGEGLSFNPDYGGTPKLEGSDKNIKAMDAENAARLRQSRIRKRWSSTTDSDNSIDERRHHNRRRKNRKKSRSTIHGPKRMRHRSDSLSDGELCCADLKL